MKADALGNKGPMSGGDWVKGGGVVPTCCWKVPGGGAATEEYRVKFLLMIYGNDEMWSSLSKQEFDALIAGDAAFRKEVRESGELISVEGLQDSANARAVKVRDGVPVVTDGPYLESKEYLASFFVLDCDSLDRVLELAAKYPTAKANGVEVWPLMDPNGADG
jgi:hypothetical protein